MQTFARRLPLRGIRGTSVRSVSSLEKFATINPELMSPSSPHTVKNLVGGEWVLPKSTSQVPDPLTGEIFMNVADTSVDEVWLAERTCVSCLTLCEMNLDTTSHSNLCSRSSPS